MARPLTNDTTIHIRMPTDLLAAVRLRLAPGQTAPDYARVAIAEKLAREGTEHA